MSIPAENEATSTHSLHTTSSTRDQQRRLEALLNASPDHIFSLDLQGSLPI